MVLKIDKVNFTYPDQIQGLIDASLEIPTKNFVVVLGESGSGKTTLAKVIAGIFNPQSGRVILNDEDITNLTTSSRDLTMVFQNFVLYPHMTIYENVMTSLNGIDLSDDEKDQLVKKLLSQFGLIHYLNFKPRNLSDGQKQRVSICKALVREPFLFILDEPLSNLDLPQRKAIRKELKDLYNKNESTYIYITHDIDDAEYLSTLVVLVDKGHILQVGSIQEIKEQPKTAKCVDLIYGGLVNKMQIDNSPFVTELLKNSPKEEANKLLIPYKSLSISDKGKYSGLFKTAMITPKGVLITVIVDQSFELSMFLDCEDVEYKENDIIRFDVVKSFVF